MMDFITVPLVVGICTLSVYKLFELFVRKKERLMLIEKLNDQLSIGDITERLRIPLISNHFNMSFSALKGGFLMLGIGLGLLFAFTICCLAFPNYTISEQSWRVVQQAGVVYGACVLIFGGAGLLAAFLIEMKLFKKEQK